MSYSISTIFDNEADLLNFLESANHIIAILGVIIFKFELLLLVSLLLIDEVVSQSVFISY